MKKGPNPKLFILLTIVTMVVGVALCLFEYSGVQDSQGKLAKLKKDSLDQDELENHLRTSQSQLEECSASLNHLEKNVPAMDYVPTMLKELQNIGTQSGLDVLGVRPVPAAQTATDVKSKKKEVKKSYNTLDIEVTCRGTYHSAKTFVQALQTFPKVVEARTVAMTPKVDAKTQNAAPKLDVTISLRSYLFPDNGDMKAAPAVHNEGGNAS
jgi:Tfp pilus assembly protein PilO